MNRGDLSKAENGKIQVPATMFERVMAVLETAPSTAAGMTPSPGSLPTSQ